MLIELSPLMLGSVFNQGHMYQQCHYMHNNKAAIPSLANGTNQWTLRQEEFQNTDSNPHAKSPHSVCRAHVLHNLIHLTKPSTCHAVLRSGKYPFPLLFFRGVVIVSIYFHF